MDKTEARALLSEVVAEQQRQTYEQWSALIDQRESLHLEVGGASGAEYQVDIQPLWDSDEGGVIRVIASIDDGGLLSAMIPLSKSFLVEKPG